MATVEKHQKGWRDALASPMLAQRFDYHPPKNDDVVDSHQSIRGAAKAFAAVVMHETEVSREQSLAITAIEEAMMWANAAIARYQD